jgi:hypothetical protein
MKHSGPTLLWQIVLYADRVSGNIMDVNTSPVVAQEIILDFARLTGLDPPGIRPERYLWTDAFAVCTCLGIFCRTQDATWRDLGLRLVDQVHHTLGRYREDGKESGWISGLSAQEGEIHPTAGGLRIGKSLPERRIDEGYNERLEWERDGQYFHYLTKWMHALSRVSQVTGDPKYIRWAIELAQVACARFTYLPSPDSRKRMYWKMSTDLTRPLIPSMGQHDPLDGFVTCAELQLTPGNYSGLHSFPSLATEMAVMAGICRGMELSTADPLGTGGLLSDALRIAQLSVVSGTSYGRLLESVVDSALPGLVSSLQGGSLDLPAKYRLAFRELGLAIGLAGAKNLCTLIRQNPELFKDTGSLQHKVEAILAYMPLKEAIIQFWMSDKNRKSPTWTRHKEISMVMLATGIVPDGFLTL